MRKVNGFILDDYRLRKIVFSTSGSEHCLNCYIDMDGTIHPTPFKMPRAGVWYFDGQVFYQKRGI